MSSGPNSLLKILKDETRRKIVLLLTEKGNLSYTDLLNNLEIGSTGKLNYHLQVLGELLAKNEDGHYVLTEKGRVASRLLIEFPEKEKEVDAKEKRWREFWIVAVAVNFAGLVFVLVLYALGYFGGEWLFQGVFGFFSGLIFFYFFYRMFRPPTKKQQVKKDFFRTVEEVLVSGRELKEVKDEVMSWVKDEKIVTEEEQDHFISGHLGSLSTFALNSPKFFEVTLRPDQKGVMVHVEGYIIILNQGERSFSKGEFIGMVPRREGLMTMQKLLKRLRGMSK